MQTKLTLRMDGDLIRRAKAHAERSGRSLSSLVADFFAVLDSPSDRDVELSPTVRDLLGVLAGTDLDDADHSSHLVEKHQRA